MNETNAEPYPGQFRIVWNSEKAEYRVSIPDYNGGEVVPLETVKSLEAHQSARIAELERRVEEKDQEIAMLQREMAGAIDNEQARWQDGLDALFARLIPDANLDGGGCDSGDPLDFSLSEVSQAIQHVEAKTESELSQLRAEVERLTKERDGARTEAQLAHKERDEARALHKVAGLTVIELDKQAKSLRAQLAEREEDRALLDPHARDILTIIAQDVECYCCTDGVPTKQPCGSCLAKAAIRAARAQPEDGK